MNVSKQYDIKKNLSLSDDRSIAKVKLENNLIKRYLIDNNIKEGDYVLDCSSGRGGDLTKLSYRKISYYRGIDISPVSTADANVRHEESRKENTFQADFITYDLTTLLPYSTITYDVCMSMFAIHYAFKDRESADNYIQNMVSSRAKTIIIVTTNENNIRKALTSHNPILHITDVSAFRDDDYGKEILFNIGNAWSKDAIPEYTVSSDLLIRKFADHGYSLKSYKHFSDLIRSKVNKYEHEIISLYDSYVFINDVLTDSINI